MPILYDDLGIRFQFPENWNLESDDELDDQPSVTVYSPGGAFWTVVRRKPEDDVARLADEAAAALQKEYPGADRETVHESIVGVDTDGFDLNFIYLDLISTACIRWCHTPTAAYLIVCQAEDREFGKLQPVFKALTTSLLAESGRASGTS